MTTKLLFFVTTWTAIAMFGAFMIVGIVEQMDRWWQQRHNEGKQ